MDASLELSLQSQGPFRTKVRSNIVENECNPPDKLPDGLNAWSINENMMIESFPEEPRRNFMYEAMDEQSKNHG